jgi:hypothetical protein
MMWAVDRLGLPLLFRIKKSSVSRSRRGQQHRLADLVKRDESWSGTGWLFSSPEDRLWMTVHLIWEVGQSELWCLATNEKGLRASGYALRMWQTVIRNTPCLAPLVIRVIPLLSSSDSVDILLS